MDSTGRGCAIGRSRRPSSRRSKVQWTRPTLTSTRPTWTACRPTTSAAGMWTSKSTNFFSFFLSQTTLTLANLLVTKQTKNPRRERVQLSSHPTTTTPRYNHSTVPTCSEPIDSSIPACGSNDIFFFFCFTPERYMQIYFLRLGSPPVESASFKSV